MKLDANLKLDGKARKFTWEETPRYLTKLRLDYNWRWTEQLRVGYILSFSDGVFGKRNQFEEHG